MRLTDADGMRLTCFATNTAGRPIAELELRHRLRARAEHVLIGKARLWEPRRLRLRLLTAAGQLVTTGRRRILRLARHWPWTGHVTAALDWLAELPDPG